MSTPSPKSGVFKWAWYRAKEYRARFWIGAALFTLVVALIVSRLPLPPHPTATQNLIASVLAVIGATILTGIGSYACALLAAPFQQRNLLRLQLVESMNRIAALQATPVSQEHGYELRRLAARLRECIERNGPLDYGTDTLTWRRAFQEHFPELQDALDKASEADVAVVKLKERLRAEVAAMGMNVSPWTSIDFLPWLATNIQARALQHILGSPYNFDWQEIGLGSVYIGDPIYVGHQILDSCDPADVPARRQDFEEFFRRAEAWPEATAIREIWDERGSTAGKAIELLAAAAHTDPITSRCFLCQGFKT